MQVVLAIPNADPRHRPNTLQSPIPNTPYPQLSKLSQDHADIPRIRAAVSVRLATVISTGGVIAVMHELKK